VEVTPEALERAEFDSTGAGFDPDAVRELLRKAADRIRSLERDGVRSVSESVSAVLDQAVRSGEELMAAARNDADAVRFAADAQVDEILAAAENTARDRAAQVTKDAQLRLDRLLEAEREVHDRLQTTMSDILEFVSRVGVNQPAEFALKTEEPGDRPGEDDIANRRPA